MNVGTALSWMLMRAWAWLSAWRRPTPRERARINVGWTPEELEMDCE